MSAVFETVLSLSIAGTICIGMLFLLRRLMPSAARVGALYYVWLIVVARLLIPWSPAPGPAGEIVSLAVQDTANPAAVNSERPAPEAEDYAGHKPEQRRNEKVPDPGIFVSCAGCVWLGVACVLFSRRVVSYAHDARSLAAESESAPAALAKRVQEIALEMGVSDRVRIRVFQGICSPMLIGLLRPQLFVPRTLLNSADLGWVVRHELIHARRLDVLYKWIVQAAVCALVQPVRAHYGTQNQPRLRTFLRRGSHAGHDPRGAAYVWRHASSCCRVRRDVVPRRSRRAALGKR